MSSSGPAVRSLATTSVRSRATTRRRSTCRCASTPTRARIRRRPRSWPSGSPRSRPTRPTTAIPTAPRPRCGPRLAEHLGQPAARDLPGQRQQRGAADDPAHLRRSRPRARSLFEPTYALHAHLARITATEVVEGRTRRRLRRSISTPRPRSIEQHRPSIVFVCSPNNPTGTVEPREVVTALLDRGRATAACSSSTRPTASSPTWSALELVDDTAPARRRAHLLEGVVARGGAARVRCRARVARRRARQGRAAVPPARCRRSSRAASRSRTATRWSAASRRSSRSGGGCSPRCSELDGITVFPSGANFLLFRVHGDGRAVWKALLARGVLVRDFSRWPRLDECLRVTVGTPAENDAFLGALRGAASGGDPREHSAVAPGTRRPRRRTSRVDLVVDGTGRIEIDDRHPVLRPHARAAREARRLRPHAHGARRPRRRSAPHRRGRRDHARHRVARRARRQGGRAAVRERARPARRGARAGRARPLGPPVPRVRRRPGRGVDRHVRSAARGGVLEGVRRRRARHAAPALAGRAQRSPRDRGVVQGCRPRRCATRFASKAPACRRRRASSDAGCRPVGRVAVLDYGIGNLRSAEKALAHLGAAGRAHDRSGSRARRGRCRAARASGTSAPCMAALRAAGLEELAREAATSGRPFLGVCIGMQMLFEGSDEAPGRRRVSACCPGRVTRLPATVKLPADRLEHRRAGRAARRSSPGLPDPAWLYFVHSYAPETDAGVVAAWCEHGRRFPAAVERGNVWATQFHPEKSGDVGLRLLANFVSRLPARRQSASNVMDLYPVDRPPRRARACDCSKATSRARPCTTRTP